MPMTQLNGFLIKMFTAYIEYIVDIIDCALSTLPPNQWCVRLANRQPRVDSTDARSHSYSIYNPKYILEQTEEKSVQKKINKN
ncbi:hypothetical protein BLOT_016279 [Blomia tropicalis]|nr:hypothetical protein BLOT_016279 [Blomia tropicalis]